MRQHFFSHKIEARRIVSRRAQPEVLRPKRARLRIRSNNIRRRARDGKTVEQVFSESQLLNELSVLAGFYLRVENNRTLGEIAGYLSLRWFRNMLSRQSQIAAHDCPKMRRWP